MAPAYVEVVVASVVFALSLAGRGAPLVARETLLRAIERQGMKKQQGEIIRRHSAAPAPSMPDRRLDRHPRKYEHPMHVPVIAIPEAGGMADAEDGLALGGAGDDVGRETER